MSVSKPLLHKKHRSMKKNKIIVKYSNDDDSSDMEIDEDDEDEQEKCLNVSYLDNKIYFRASINEKTVEKLIKIIDKKNKEYKDYIDPLKVKVAEPQPLYLHITSYGGDLMSSFRAIDSIKKSYLPIFTVVDGYAASGATLMSIVGKRRFMTPNSYMLIHQLSGGSIGKYWEIKDEYQNCEMWMNDIFMLYTQHTKISEEKLHEYLAHDLWWKCDRCIQEGLIDEIF